MSIERFALAPCDHPECDEYGQATHVHPNEWNSWWSSLSESQRQSLRDKARWEHCSLMAAAIDWGVADVVGDA